MLTINSLGITTEAKTVKEIDIDGEYNRDGFTLFVEPCFHENEDPFTFCDDHCLITIRDQKASKERRFTVDPCRDVPMTVSAATMFIRLFMAIPVFEILNFADMINSIENDAGKYFCD